MRTITSQWIDKWLERISYWQQFLQKDVSDNVKGKVVIARAKDELGEEEVRVEVDIVLKAHTVLLGLVPNSRRIKFNSIDVPDTRKQSVLEFSTLDGQEKFDEVEEFIHDAEEYWCMPCLQGLRMTTQKYKDTMAEYMRRNAQRGCGGDVRSDWEKDECIGYDSAQ